MLGLWVGSDVFLSFCGGAVVLFGFWVAEMLLGLWWGLRWGGSIVAGGDLRVLLLLARMIRTRTVAGFVAPWSLCVVLMMGLPWLRRLR